MYYDEICDQREEHFQFTYDSPAEVDRDDAWLAGSTRPDQDWILSDRDVWYANPYYNVAKFGPRGEHPEYAGCGHDEEFAGPLYGPAEVLADDDEIPF
jgi:hypothetical protein